MRPIVSKDFCLVCNDAYIFRFLNFTNTVIRKNPLSSKYIWCRYVFPTDMYTSDGREYDTYSDALNAYLYRAFGLRIETANK